MSLKNVQWNYVGSARVADWVNSRSVAVSGDMVKLTVNNCADDCSICRSRVELVNRLVRGKQHTWLGHTNVVLHGYDGVVTPQAFLTKELGLLVELRN